MHRRQRGDPHGEPHHCGPWVREKIMGKGAFGSVTLWHNERTNSYICIKECHAMELSDRQRSQWEIECKIMLKLSHPNVVRGLPTPPELDNGMSGIPVLAVEYCQSGDLRKVLNRAENSCGLPEIQVRAIARDISLAVEFLHGKKIVHRDLKPENIVLKNLALNKFQYKLIDLGYAKDISAGSICKSFVGTEQYLAPELFMSVPGGHYNNNVDYWCLGTTIFECIVGWRPFFHGTPALQWLKNVSEKKNNEICGIINLENDVVFSKTIPNPHQLCRYAVHNFEIWLRLMLTYHPNQRGGGMTANNKPVCFDLLESILKAPILHVYNISSNRVVSVPINDEMTLGDVLNTIHNNPKIPPPDQEFISINGILLTEDKLAKRYTTEQDEESLVFLVPSASFEAVFLKRPQPELVGYLLQTQSTKTQIPFDLLKRVYSHFLFYVIESNRDYRKLLQAKDALNVYLMTKKKDLTREKTRVTAHHQDLRSRIDIFNECFQLDDEKLEGLKSSGIYSPKMATFWRRTKEQVARLVHLDQEVQQINQQCSTLEKNVMDMNQVPRGRTGNFGAHWEKKITELYEKLRKTPKENRTNEIDNSEICRHTSEYMAECFRQMHDLQLQIQLIIRHKQEIILFLPSIVQLQHKMQQAKDKISTFQRQRQSDIWGLFHELSEHAKSVDMSDGPMPATSKTFNSRQHVALVSPEPVMAAPVAISPSLPQGSMMSCNSSLVIEKSHEESMSLRNESISNMQNMKQTISNIEQFVHRPPQLPDWECLNTEDSMQE